jgi:hypothetical protein
MLLFDSLNQTWSNCGSQAALVSLEPLVRYTESICSPLAFLQQIRYLIIYAMPSLLLFKTQNGVLGYKCYLPLRGHAGADHPNLCQEYPTVIDLQ